jgi:hypothetical protein
MLQCDPALQEGQQVEGGQLQTRIAHQ